MKSLPVLLLALVGLASPVAAAESPAETSGLKRIGAAEAEKHFQENCVVTGRVAQVTERPNLTYLNLEKPHPNSPLTGIVFSKTRNLFGDLTNLQGRNVELTGRIEDHQGQLQIVLNAASQLKVVGGTNAPKRISAVEAPAHVNQSCIVTGTVAQVSLRPNMVFLNLQQEHPFSPLTGVIFSRATNQFGDLAPLKGKAVELTGVIEDHRGQAQIILNSTNQLKVVNP